MADEFKVYKEKPYNNSNGEPFGVTLNGRTREYIQAHHQFRDLIKKGSQLEVDYRIGPKEELKTGKLKFLNVISTKSIIDSTVEVIPQEGSRGNVQLKSYFPSNSKKKGASTELRKLSGYDYELVVVLKAMVTNFLDKFISGGSLEDNVKESKKDGSRDTVYSCDLCNYKTKSQAGVKTHKTRIHKQNKCDICEFSSEDTKKLEKHTVSKHNKTEEGLKRLITIIQCEICRSTFDSKEKMEEHVKNQHENQDQNVNNDARNKSPTSSPSRKKIELDESQNKQEAVEVNGMEIDDNQEEVKVSIKESESRAILIEKIEQLELRIHQEKEENKKLLAKLTQLENFQKDKLNERDIKKGEEKHTKGLFEIPKHLKSVHEDHKPKLFGFKMRYCAIPNGACLTNCLTAHISCTEDEEERKINNRRVNNHIAEHFDNYYHNKITLPYTEVVGVGNTSRTVTCETAEEFKTFLRSEDSLCVYSNSQELQAIANILNIKVKIFSFGIGGDITRCEWKEVHPDPEMLKFAIFPKGFVPDLFLYNSDQSRYDLLVAEDHKLATLGLVELPQAEQDLVTGENKDSNGWKVQGKQSKNLISSEMLIMEENKTNEYDEIDLEELVEDVEIATAKKRGFRRTSPASPSEAESPNLNVYKCTWKNCDKMLESEGILRAHTQEHKKVFCCKFCDEGFTSEKNMKEHIKMKHENSDWYCVLCDEDFQNETNFRKHKDAYHEGKEWNCDGCSFQANGSAELINHLKLTGHQPSQSIKDSKSKITHCYTCREEFSSYWGLMNHRNQKHPSNKPCRYFLKNECIHGRKCWYRHIEPMEVDGVSKQFSQSSVDINCQSCGQAFEDWGKLREHKRTKHETNTAANSCQPKDSEQLGFRLPLLDPVPPDQTKEILKTLQVVLQKMDVMQKFFHQIRQ